MAKVVLLGYATGLEVLGPLAMRAHGWTLRDPELATWIWQAQVASWVVSVGLAGLVTIAGRWYAAPHERLGRLRRPAHRGRARRWRYQAAGEAVVWTNACGRRIQSRPNSGHMTVLAWIGK
jgi:hypothetical protein